MSVRKIYRPKANEGREKNSTRDGGRLMMEESRKKRERSIGSGGSGGREGRKVSFHTFKTVNILYRKKKSSP